MDLPRGQHEKDRTLFAAPQLPVLRRATAELSWLLGRGYAEKSALALVGDRHQLVARQRMAVWRSACSDQAREARASRRVEMPSLRGQTLWIDGLNVLITTEAALSGGVVIVGRDGWTRDIASIHGSYRRVSQTSPAIERLGEELARAGVGHVGWLLDRPVSNSGRLAELLREHARIRGLAWTVELENDPDGLLVRADGVVASSDGWILDRVGHAVDLPGAVIAYGCPPTTLIDLRDG